MRPIGYWAIPEDARPTVVAARSANVLLVAYRSLRSVNTPDEPWSYDHVDFTSGFSYYWSDYVGFTPASREIGQLVGASLFRDHRGNLAVVDPTTGQVSPVH